MSTSQDDVRGITSGFITIGGSSCVGFTSGPYVNSVQFQLLTGSTATSLVGVSTLSQGALLFANQPQNFGGPVSLWINEFVGTTSIVQFIKTLTIGPSTPLTPLV